MIAFAFSLLVLWLAFFVLALVIVTFAVLLAFALGAVAVIVWWVMRSLFEGLR
jgi:hypothetical protein